MLYLYKILNMDIIENSKTIANYLGWKYVPFEPGLEVKAGWYKPSAGILKGSVRLPDMGYWKHVCRRHDQLRFYNSFDFLVPAIDSLEAEELEEYFYSWRDDWGSHSDFMSVSFERVSDFSVININLQLNPSIMIGSGANEGIIKDTFKAVVEAIKFVNNLKKNEND